VTYLKDVTVTTPTEWLEPLIGFPPHPWQARLAADTLARSRLVRVPTGLGKTAGVVGAWAYNRIHRRDDTWPRRLVFCFPMRVLVEQSAEAIRSMLHRVGLGDEVDVDILMGGVRPDPDEVPWHLRPERFAILLGTQDMLLSRALNRGYAAPRGRWPMAYALLHSDALWVADEVQLMGVGLATSTQLQAFRDDAPGPRPSHTWWMSATLQPDWLATYDALPELERRRADMTEIPAAERGGTAFEGKKPLSVESIPAETDAKLDAWADRVLRAHADAEPTGTGRVTLAIANTVRDAVSLYEQLGRKLDGGVTLELVHSRFRGHERAQWRDRFLRRDHCLAAETNLIIVATQVVEAGVDISATALVTQLAPWSSLVQRFGRAARYGGACAVVVVDRALDEKRAAPYELPALSAAKEALARLDKVDIADLEDLEASLLRDAPDFLARLYPYSPMHLLRRQDHHELFDTGQDLTGMDIDVSRFVRDGLDSDVQVYWREVDDNPTADARATLRTELCPVSIGAAKKWIERVDGRAWTWRYLDNTFRAVRHYEVRPGMTIVVDATAGGYDERLGFTGAARAKNDPPVGVIGSEPLDHTAAAALRADLAQDAEDLSEAAGYKSIALHGQEAAEEAAALCRELGLDPAMSRLVELAARLHDYGKIHPAFQSLIVERLREDDRDLAKAPAGAWRRPPVYMVDDDSTVRKRPGFRHELASVLAMFEMLRRVAPDHEALLGPHAALIEAGVLMPLGSEADKSEPNAIEAALCELSGEAFDLVAYLVCAHHGKLRASWQSTPQDQDAPVVADDPRGPPLRGVRDGDVLPGFDFGEIGGRDVHTEDLTLSLDPARLGLSDRYGRSWRDRTEALLTRHGPHALALYETLVRVADVRASMRRTLDPRWETGS
jgi:CRISPR-associated endonuclease/helicase Cas3